MSLLVVTDTQMRARDHRRVGPRRWSILAALALGAQPALAQDAPKVPGGLRVRRVVLARAPADRPAVTVYGTAGQPLLLKFDAPIGKGPVRASGVEVRRPARPLNTLLVTPSRALAASRSSVPVVVPFPGGPLTLTLVLKPEAPDGQVNIVRMREPSSLATAEKERPTAPETLRFGIPALSAPEVRVIVSDAAWPDDAIKCRVSLLVQTPDVPSGIPMEIRSADPALCQARCSPSMRVDGGR